MFFVVWWTPGSVSASSITDKATFPRNAPVFTISHTPTLASASSLPRSLPLCSRAPLVHQLSLARSDKSCSIFNRHKKRDERRDSECINAFAATRRPHEQQTAQQLLLEAEMFITPHNMKALDRIKNTMAAWLFLEV